ncbi:MAG TPA: hypothetical protein VFZ93_06340 [Albitalea sp.]
MPAHRSLLERAIPALPNRPGCGRAWRCVACGLFHGSIASRSRPRACTACHSGAIYAVAARSGA